jgi:hypothetical protein
MKRKSLVAAALAGGALMGLSSLAQAAPAVVASSPQHIIVQAAPPAPVYETTPAPREGWVWTPGFYEWRDGQYVWNTGRWIQDRPGWQWQESRWLQRPDGSWYLVGGQWVRSDRYAYDDDDRRGRNWNRGPNGDMDRDGVRNADDRDRDGDGVANRDDDFPSNPNRS